MNERLAEWLQKTVMRVRRWEMIAAISLLLLLLVAAAAAADSVGTNVTVNLTMNGTAGSASFPGGNATLNLSENATLNFRVNVPAQNLSLNLSPGSAQNLTGAYDVLGLFCAAAPAAQTCTSHRTLASGETWQQVGGACDLNFVCSPGSVVLANGTACPTVGATTTTCSQDGNYTNVTILKNLTIEKTGSVFRVTLENRTTLISEDFTNATQSVEVAYTCPLQITNISDAATADGVLNMCSAYLPLYMDWLNVTIHGCIDDGEAFREYLKTRDQVVAAANQELSTCTAAGGMKDGQIQVLNAQVANLNDIVLRGQTREQIYVICVCVLFVVVIALTVGLVVLAHRAGAEG